MDMNNLTGSVVALVTPFKKDGSVDFEKLTLPRTIYLGPSAYDRFTFTRTVVQGGEFEVNPAAIQVELTYTLVK